MITIVIPLYNKEQSLPATLRSVLAQTYTDYEVVVVNDGSTDGSADVVRDFIRANDGMSRADALNEPLLLNDGKIRLITQENAGVSAARNAGILAAKGEYVTFIDADDLWTPDYLETLDKLIRDFPDAGLYSIGYWVINTPNPPSREQIEKYNCHAFRGRVNNPWIEDMDLYIGSTCSSKERLIRVGLLDTRMTHGEDLDICWRLILEGGLVRDRRCCAFYRVDSENRAMNRVAPLEKIIPYYIDKYTDARARNADFRKFFDKQMIYRLYPYMLDERYRKEARKIAKRIDYSQLKWSMHFRMLFPRIYYILRKYL